jgi:hypothetical protein
MTDIEAIQLLKQVWKEIPSTHIGRVLKSEKNSQLYKWLISNTPKICKTIIERVAIAIHDPAEYICEFGNRKTYSHSTKFTFCGNYAVCKCKELSRKAAYEQIKNKRITNNGSYWTADMKAKSVSTNQTKYNADHHLKSDIGLHKYQQSIKEKYGPDVVSTLQLDSVKQKIKTTNLEKYGVEYPTMRSDIAQEHATNRVKNHGSHWTADMLNKAVSTSRKKYNADHHLMTRTGLHKYQQSIKEKYGPDVVSTLQLDSVKQKIKTTNLERYGVENPTQSEDVQAVKRSKEIANYGVASSTQRHLSPERVAEFHNDNVFTKIYNSHGTIVELSDYFGYTDSPIRQRANQLGLPRKSTSGISDEEMSLANWLSQYTTVEQSNRSLISPYEIDIFLPEHSLAIEYNGLYWHSSKYVDKNYHLNKTKMLMEKNIKLIHVFSDDYTNKCNIVKSRLLAALNLNKRIYARNTCVKEINNTAAKQFLETNHLSGYVNSKIKLGLYYDNELVAVMTFGKPRFNKEYEWELLRFANKLNTTVVGGASRLLSHFVKMQNPNSVISYSDLTWGVGNVYCSMGFEFSHLSPPNYSYLIKDRASRHQYQKHKLKKILTTFDESKTEEENMELNGYYRIYDCGNAVWLYKK